MSFRGRLNHRLFGISPDEALFARRGFRPARDPQRQARLEEIGRTFVSGYLVALGDLDLRELSARLDETPLVRRGFAYEGAAMALGLLDDAWPRRSTRFAAFVDGPGAHHRYMLHVGYGWAAARLPWRRLRLHRERFGLLHWLVVDGYGFHEAYFRAARTVAQHRVPRALRGYARRAFDQGLGRGLWFVNGADVERVATCVGGFPADRQPDLWSGVGLAVTYAGGASPEELRWLHARADEHGAHVAQGAAFAAGARDLAGTPAAHTEAAALALCGMSASALARLTEETRETARAMGADMPAYESWRGQLRRALSAASDDVAMTGGVVSDAVSQGATLTTPG